MTVTRGCIIEGRETCVLYKPCLALPAVLGAVGGHRAASETSSEQPLP